MKLQAPISKLQRTARPQKKAAKDTGVEYPKANGYSWGAKENALLPLHVFDLEERTAVWGENVVRFLEKIPRGPNNDRLIDQLTGCGTSIGANHCESNEARSKEDFRNIIGRCRKGYGVQVLSAPDRHVQTQAGRRSPNKLPRSQRAASNLLQHLSQNFTLTPQTDPDLYAHDIDH